MIQSKTVDVGLVALLAAATVIAAAATSHAGDPPSADVAPTSLASPVEAFDLTGLLQAEVNAGEALFNTAVGLPGVLIGDVINPIAAALSDAAALNFGEAFSALAGMPIRRANTIIDLPIILVEGLYGMVLTIPGQYLFNFGGGDARDSGHVGGTGNVDNTGNTDNTDNTDNIDITRSTDNTGNADNTGSTDTAGNTGDAPAGAAATAPAFEAGDSGGPYIHSVQGLLDSGAGTLTPMVEPHDVFDSTAMSAILADFLPGDALWRDCAPRAVSGPGAGACRVD